MMNTPICDFLKNYADKSPIRFHMPGHKGASLLGIEATDLTEIVGADSLWEANGIIAESEKNASSLFGAHTFYSTEGSSLAIRGMMYLLKLWGENPLIIATRNCHKSFITAISALNLEVEWLYPKNDDNYLSCSFDINDIEEKLSANPNRKCAVYITTPDYLGGIADVFTVSKICKRHNALLCVDNAHGAYLKFLEKSIHPMDLGADLCCDSAHKTLPVITGGAYLHISNNAPRIFAERAKEAMAFFGSTSPSYLILASLDRANLYLSEGFSEKLKNIIAEIALQKAILAKNGYNIIGSDPLKIVIKTKDYGYYGEDLEAILNQNNLFCEFAHKDHLVLMLSSETTKAELEKAVDLLCAIPKKEPICEIAPLVLPCEKAVSPAETLFRKSEILPISQCEGRIFAETNIACPPAVPLIVAGEIIDKQTIKCFEYYGVKRCRVLCENQ